MLKIIKKALLLSLCISQFIFSMRQIVQSALINAVSKSQIVQLASARMLNQSRSFNNSPVVRCPISFLQTLMEDINSEESTTVVDESETTNCSDGSKSHLRGFRIINENTAEGYINLHQEHEEVTSWQLSSLDDKIQDRLSYNDMQAAQHRSQILSRVRLGQEQETYLAKMKSERSFCFSNYQAIVQAETAKHVDSASCLSRQEIANKTDVLEQELCLLKRARAEAIEQNSQLCYILGITRDDFQDGAIRYDLLENLGIEDQYKALNLIKLNVEIDAREAAIKEYSQMMYRPERESRDFVNKVENASVDVIEKQILPDLIAKKDQLTSFFIEKRNEQTYKAKKFNDIEAQIDLLNKRSRLEKFKAMFKQDVLQESLANNKIKVKAEQQKIARELALVNNEKIKCESQIKYAQKTLDEKKQIELQEAQLAQENQEALVVHQETVKSQHDSCNFDTTDCSDPELVKQWTDRQEALSKTIEQGYVQYNQQYNLAPEVIAVLATHGINYNDFKNFYGTALQQQLHGEMCDVLSQAAIQQIKCGYQNKLLTSIVDFADAAHDANKNNQVLLASRLLDVDCYLLKLNHQIIDAAIPYAQAGMYAMAHTVTDIVYMLVHPGETIKGLGKAIYYVLETAALNTSQEVVEHPEILEPIRDQRNAEIVAGLKDLGHKIQYAVETIAYNTSEVVAEYPEIYEPLRDQRNAEIAAELAKTTGPEKFGAVVRAIGDIVAIGKINKAICGVCGFVKGQAKALRTIEGVAGMLEEQGVAQEFIQAAEKIEVAAQENVTKAFSSELANAETNIAKSTKAVYELKSTQELEEVAQRTIESIKELLKNTTPGETTRGRARQYIKNGSYEDAVKDFYSLNPSNVKKMSGKEGLHGTLPDGRSINVRLESTYNTSISRTEIMKSGNTAPTIEIMKEGGAGTRIKIRYENKL